MIHTKLRADVLHLTMLLLFCLLLPIACSDSEDETTAPIAQQNAPRITSFHPESGTPGDAVTIIGANFTTAPGDVGVSFGGVPAEPHVVNDTEITVTVPVGAISGPLAATSDGAGATSHEEFTVLWEETTFPGSPVNFTSVCWTGTQFVAVGGLGAVITSPDGLTWTRHATSPAVNLNAVAAGDGQIIAGGASGSLFRSTNGSSWELLQSVPLEQTDVVTSIATDGSIFVAAPRDRGFVVKSLNGISWRRDSVANDASLRYVLYGARFILFTEGDTIWYSPDDVVWDLYLTNLVAPAVKSGAYHGNRTVIVKPNSLLSTPDIVSGMWADVTPAAALMTTFDAVTWAGLFFVVVGPEAIWSIDGVAWHTLAQFPKSPTSEVHVASSLDIAVAVGGFGNSIMIWRKPL